MVIVRFIIGIVATIIAIKLLAFVLALVSVVLKLIGLTIVVGLFALVIWILYKIFSPPRAEQV
ncbi:MAG TPA: hypothetical protein VJZ26_08870 [Blastocatellia bacterium]|nr:hypothetical protein [Blastocatellia bacterium]